MHVLNFDYLNYKLQIVVLEAMGYSVTRRVPRPVRMLVRDMNRCVTDVWMVTMATHVVTLADFAQTRLAIR